MNTITETRTLFSGQTTITDLKNMAGEHFDNATIRME